MKTIDDLMAPKLARLHERLLETDVRVAKRLGIRTLRSGEFRVSKGRLQAHRELTWRNYRRYRDAGMGEVTDRIVAEKLGVSHQAVQLIRLHNGIPEYGRAIKRLNRELLVARLEALAKRHKTARDAMNVLHVPVNRIHALAKELGIPLAKPEPRVKFTKQTILSTIRRSRTLAIAAEKLGIFWPSLSVIMNSRGLRKEIDAILMEKGYRRGKDGRLFPPASARRWKERKSK